MAPIVVQTRRGNNQEPETVQIVLDGPIPEGETTTFTFDDGEAINVVEYTYGLPNDIPALSEWGMIVLTLLVAVAGTLVFRYQAGRRAGAGRTVGG